MLTKKQKKKLKQICFEDSLHEMYLGYFLLEKALKEKKFSVNKILKEYYIKQNLENYVLHIKPKKSRSPKNQKS